MSPCKPQSIYVRSLCACGPTCPPLLAAETMLALYDSRKRFSSAWVACRAIQRTWPGLLAVFALFGSPHSYAFQSSAWAMTDLVGTRLACVRLACTFLQQAEHAAHTSLLSSHGINILCIDSLAPCMD